jgi:HTH-type transcriptional regulator/antitoxin HipB
MEKIDYERDEREAEEARARDAFLATLGERVRDVRKAAGLTQKQLAEAVGVAPSYVTTVETGGQNLTVWSLAKLAEALGMDISRFFPALNGSLGGYSPAGVEGIKSVLDRLVSNYEAQGRELELLRSELAKASDRRSHRG